MNEVFLDDAQVEALAAVLSDSELAEVLTQLARLNQWIVTILEAQTAARDLDRLPPMEREQFLAQREEIVRYGDELAQELAGEPLPEPLGAAQREASDLWPQVKVALRSLTH